MERVQLVGLARKYWLILFIFVSLLFVIIYLSHEVGKLEHVLRVSIVNIAYVVILQFLFWLMVSVIWKRIVLKVSLHRITVLESCYHVSLVCVGKYLPGKVWGMLARGYHMKQYGIAPGSVIYGTYLEQFFLLYSGVIVTAFLYGVLFTQNLAWFLTIVSIVGAIGARYFGDTILKKISDIYSFLFKKTKKFSMEYFISTLDYYLFLAAYAVVWLLSGLIFYGIYLAFFPATFSTDTLLLMMLANTVSITVGFFAIFAPGGVGVREGVSTLILATHLPVADAVLLSLLFRLWVVFTELLVGGGIFLAMIKRPIRKIG